MYVLRYMFDLAKLVSRHFKAKFGPELVRIMIIHKYIEHQCKDAMRSLEFL
jgi:hypothetical protein